MSRSCWAIVGVVAVFLVLLWHYGDVVILIPDEPPFIEPAKNLAEGRGMGTPVLDNLLPGISQRTYWYPPSYFVALSLWGKLFGFELSLVRWFNRFFGAIGLVLLFALACQWGLPAGIGVLCVLWTALDALYQYNFNSSGGMLNLATVFMLAMLLTFTAGCQKNRQGYFLLAGIFAGLMVLSHPLWAPVIVVLWGTCAWQRRWREIWIFSLPILFGLMAWLLYALQDWSSFIGQMTPQLSRKVGHEFSHAFRNLFLSVKIAPVWGVFPVNSPPWLIIIVMGLIAALRKHLTAQGWQFAVIFIAYLAICFGACVPAELWWYAGAFAPLGFLLVGLLWKSIARSPKERFVLSIVAMLWVGFQVIRIAPNIAAAPTIHHDAQRFFQALETELSPRATVLIFSAPNPFFHLSRTRPDLHLYQIVGMVIDPYAFKRLKSRTHYFVGLWEWMREDGLFRPEEAEQVKRWMIRAPLGSFHVSLVTLRQLGRSEGDFQ